MKEYRRRYREKHGLPPEKDTPSWKKRAAVVLALCVIGFGGFFAAQSKAEQMVTLNGQSIADMTDDEITNYLDSTRRKRKTASCAWPRTASM